MKFKNYLEGIVGVGTYPMVSLFIFFTFFVILTVWAVRVNKGYISEMKNLPFGKENENN